MNSPSRQPLTETEMQTALGELPGWAHAKDRLTKLFQFKNFREAFAFLTRVAFEAEQLDHHPEIHNVYNKVTLALNTHDAGGKVTGMDVELARRIEKLRS